MGPKTNVMSWLAYLILHGSPGARRRRYNANNASTREKQAKNRYRRAKTKERRSVMRGKCERCEKRKGVQEAEGGEWMCRVCLDELPHSQECTCSDCVKPKSKTKKKGSA
jgi:hypothetical protein